MICNASSWCRPGNYCDTWDRCTELWNRCRATPGAACDTDTFPSVMDCDGMGRVTTDARRYMMRIPGIGVIECDHEIKRPMSGK